jgi:Zn-dependent metalloprotease
MRFIRMAQTYRGLTVAGAGYDVRVFSSGRIGTLEGRFHPDIHIDTTPILTVEQAETRARSVFDAGAAEPTGYPRFQFEYESGFRDQNVLVVVPQSGRYLLAWAVLLRRPPNATWRVYVEATSGSILGAQNLGESWVR